jgi:hypothetical protein
MTKGNAAPSFHERYPMTKVAISDAHGVRREGLRALLRSTGGFEIVGEAVDGASTLVLGVIVLFVQNLAVCFEITIKINDLL